MLSLHTLFFLFFFNDTATTEIYTLSLHDALPISPTNTFPPPGAHARRSWYRRRTANRAPESPRATRSSPRTAMRSEEHTSELQSQSNLVCRLLLEKKKTHTNTRSIADVCHTC